MILNLKKQKLSIENNKRTQDLQQEDNQDESDDEQSVDKRKFYVNLVLKISLWSIIWIIFIKIEFGVVYLIVSLLIIIYLNTGQRNKSKLSAYSVFNPNLKRIEGTLTAEHAEKFIILQL
jgi:Mg2+/citrate symporter